MKILHTAETLKGGIATYLQCCAAVDEFEHFFLIPEAQEIELSFIKDDARKIKFKGENRKERFKNLVKELRVELDNNRYDVIFLHSSFAGYAYLLTRLFNRKVTMPRIVFCAHGWSFLRDVSGLEKIICACVDRVIVKSVDGVIHISHTEKKNAEFLKCKRDIVIYNPISEDFLANLPSTPFPTKKKENMPFRILFVGRLDRQKGFDLLYEAFRSLNPDEYCLDVVGGAVLKENKFQEQCNVRFHGWLPRSRIIKLYDCSDLVVIPSRWEGFGFVAIEALSRGCKVLVSNKGSLPEVVGEHGVIRDLSTPERIRDEIVDLKKKPGLDQYSRQLKTKYVISRFSFGKFSCSLRDFINKRVLFNDF